MIPWGMRKSTTLAVVLGTAVALVTGAAGLALGRVGGDAGRVPGAAFELAAAAKSTVLSTSAGASSRTRSMVGASVQTVTLVTVPDLATGLPESSPATSGTSDAPAADPTPGTEPAPAADPEPVAPAPAPAPAPAAPPESMPPAAEPLAPPYTAVLGWTGVGRIAYLTFDDGPGPYTGQILDILAANGVKATFCQLGTMVSESPALAARVVAQGHTLCNHSWDHHSPFDTLSTQALDQQLGRTQTAIAAATGVTARYFRAPEGRFGDPGGQVLQAAQRARTVPLGWAVDSVDWHKPGAAAITATVLGAVTPGAVILLHDGGGADREQTVAALPGIISGLQAAGYFLAPLPTDPAG